jgi:hypothetical protein
VPVPRPSPTFLVFLFAAILFGLLTMDAGQLIEQAQSEGVSAIECAPFPIELQRQSSSEFRFTAPADHAVHLDMDFLERDGNTIGTRPVALTAGATTAFSMSTQDVGTAIKVIASAPVQVDATVIYDDSVGPATRHTVPCSPITQTVRDGGL